MNELYKNVKLKEISLYPQISHDSNGDVIEYYLRLVYVVETDTEIKEIIIPKVDLGLRSNFIPGLETNYFGPGISENATLTLAHGKEQPVKIQHEYIYTHEQSCY